jgi:hypothetical protein
MPENRMIRAVVFKGVFAGMVAAFEGELVK